LLETLKPLPRWAMPSSGLSLRDRPPHMKRKSAPPQARSRPPSPGRPKFRGVCNRSDRHWPAVVLWPDAGCPRESSQRAQEARGPRCDRAPAPRRALYCQVRPAVSWPSEHRRNAGRPSQSFDSWQLPGPGDGLASRTTVPANREQKLFPPYPGNCESARRTSAPRHCRVPAGTAARRLSSALAKNSYMRGNARRGTRNSPPLVDSLFATCTCCHLRRALQPTMDFADNPSPFAKQSASARPGRFGFVPVPSRGRGVVPHSHPAYRQEPRLAQPSASSASDHTPPLQQQIRCVPGCPD